MSSQEWIMSNRLSHQFYWIAVMLAFTFSAQAEDIHIKKNITVGGNSVSSTETSIQGPRERVVTQTAAGSTITLRQCDLKRTITINERTQAYLIINDPQSDAAVKTPATASATPAADSAAYITETSTVTDTGEHKTMFGYPARHLKTKITVQSSKNACSHVNQSFDLDGWYADISKEQASACEPSLRPVPQSQGCSDPVIQRRTGSGKPGYPLTETVSLHNPDGSTIQIVAQASDVSKQAEDKQLFEIPSGFREVKSVAELNSAPASQAAQPTTASAPPVQPPAQNNTQKRSIFAQMLNPTHMQTAGPAGSIPNGTMMGQPGMGNAQIANTAVTTPQVLGPKAPGKIRIGVAPPDAQLGQGSNAGADYSTPIRNAVVAIMSGPAVEIAALDSHIAMQVQAEAQQKQCDYILYSGVDVKHAQSTGFGKFMKIGTMAASMTPMGAMTHSMGTMVAAQAAGMAASQLAQQQALSQLAGFNGQIKSKDDVTVQYQLVASGKTTPVVQNSLQGKAKTDGEDVLTPLLQQAATTVLAEVSKK
jgi:hypothetical protein